MKFSFLKELNDNQKIICKSNENIILKACPGSGKTRTLTYRLAYMSLLHEPSRKLNIAITYTNRAADEIKRRLHRLEINSETIWAGTIHQFCLEFIIRPYSMYSGRLSKGYHIIDEYIKNEYIREIVNDLGITLNFNKPEDFPEVVKQYLAKLQDNKELDFDLILNISQQLLLENLFIRENISSIIRSINVDEYQDTNNLQYDILGQIIDENKSINLLFVGDIDQAIYGGIGGLAKNKDTLERDYQIRFVEKNLNGCYRSSQRSIDYYSKFQQVYDPIESLSLKKDSVGQISLNTTVKKDQVIELISEIVKQQIENGVPECEICILAPQWWLLFPLSKKIKELLPEINFDAPDITPIKYDPLNVFYIISKLVFTKAGEETWLRKKYANEFINIIKDDYRIFISDNVDCYLILKYINSVDVNTNNGIEYFEESIKYLLNRLKIDFQNENQLKKAYNDFMNKINDRIEQYHLSTELDTFKKCFKEKDGVVINTFHGVKGEEYTTVIAMGLLQGYIPHWDLIINKSSIHCKNETKKLLYVVCSRAKENLFLFSERGRTTRQGNELGTTEELLRYRYTYDT